MTTKNISPAEQVDQIPIILVDDIAAIHATPLAADERAWCKYALRGNAAGATRCPERRCEPHHTTWCGLNGHLRRSPCAFDEPQTAPIWRRINSYLTKCWQKGWLI